MSLSPLVSFKSRFVTYLLNFPRRIYILIVYCNITLNLVDIQCKCVAVAVLNWLKICSRGLLLWVWWFNFRIPQTRFW